MLSALKALIFHAIFLALKVKHFQTNFAIFFTLFFTNSTKTSKFRQETLNILSTFKIHGIIFGILWMKSQFQPDFTNNFSLGLRFRLDHRVSHKFWIQVSSKTWMQTFINLKIRKNSSIFDLFSLLNLNI